MATKLDFSGIWHSNYQYTSSAKPGEFSSEYDVKILQKGNNLVVESLPNKEGAYVVLRLSLDGRIATGTWEEHTSPGGFYKGTIYHGAVQLVVDEDGEAMHGKYVGFSRTMKVFANDWSLKRLAPGVDLKQHAEQHAVA